MPTAIGSRQLNQTATYWGNPSSDGWGVDTFDSPVSVSVRWEDKQEMFIDENGQEKISKAVVFLSQDVDVGGWLYLGTSTTSNPKDVSGARKISAFAKIPSLSGANYMRKAWLI